MILKWNSHIDIIVNKVLKVVILCRVGRMLCPNQLNLFYNMLYYSSTSLPVISVVLFGFHLKTLHHIVIDLEIISKCFLVSLT